MIPTLQYIEWFFLNLPEIIMYALWVFVFCLVVLINIYLIYLGLFDRRQCKIELNHRIDFEFMGFRIVYPPLWFLLILAIIGIALWFLVWVP